MKLGVLVSGNGSNLQAILDAIESGQLAASVEVVISNRPGVFALERAEKAGVRALSLNHKDFENREAFDREVVRHLKDSGVEWIVLAGFMRLLTPWFLAQYPNRVVNIHPALLPAFPGTHGIEQALEYGVKVTGCTVHLVDEGTDTGPILAQKVVEVRDDDTTNTLAERMHHAEHALFVETLCRIAKTPPRVLAPNEQAGPVRKGATVRPRVVFGDD